MRSVGGHDSEHDAMLKTLAYVSGGLMAFGWFVFVDALVMHATLRLQPAVTVSYFAPGFIATTGMLMVALTPFRLLADDGGQFGGGGADSSTSCARLWFFVTLTLLFTSMVVAAFLTRALPYDGESVFSYTGIEGGGSDGEASHVWVGTASMLQTLCIFGSASLWIMLRVQRAEMNSLF